MTAMETPKAGPEKNNVGATAQACPERSRRSRPAGQSPAASPRKPGSEAPTISIIIPARNEESNLGTCLESLTTQTGVSFEIIVVNDHSTDRTQEIASSFNNVRVIEAGPLLAGWTGKNNAVTTGAREALGQWLLFTDADTIHLPGSLAGALLEAIDNSAELLSYSPE